MNNSIEYLVKYSVAPPPSRDYYGLKILQDEVILYLWKVSHGPHKTPIVRRVRFTEFSWERSLQDEIRHGFGEHVLIHVRNIAEGNRNTLLTLPKSLIGEITRYLEYRDIIKLSLLSRIAYEIFNTDLIWEILYKRDKNAKIGVGERKEAEVYGWKQLYRDRQMETLIRDQRNFGTLLSTKHANDAKTIKPSLRTTNTLKPISKTVSTVNIVMKQRSEFPDADLTTTSLSKTSSDTRFRGPNMKTEKEKSFPPRKNSKNLNSGFNVNAKSVKREDIVARKITVKGETRRVFKYDEGFDKESEKPEKYVDKSNKVKATSQEGKTKYVTSRASSVSKNIVGNARSSSDLVRGLQCMPRSKTKAEPKKTAVTSYEIFNNDAAFSNNPVVARDNSFDLADLIEASLKNIRSPRSIFNYDFSCMQRTDVTGDAPKVRHELLDLDKSKQLKSVRSNVLPNYFPGRMAQGSGILEKLSEKSESHSETSTESIVKDARIIPEKSNELLSKKCAKSRVELVKSLNERKSEPMFCKDRGDPRANFRSKYFNPKKISDVDEKFPFVKRSLRTSSLLKAHASNSSKSENSYKKC
ncbi:PREDICTED: uncharacterized protein LOC106742453 [Dinoponera quadriceps]|uniref:Uncharacterized protein LOC106742453 n=1 Tax=Dinoponera quadriceps TaxID=609295 RepID=A0A6P3WXW6_DINQU|nr:PREDICTED: uncharacterized protein LOC106742453 [Dinoponera quadriceps]